MMVFYFHTCDLLKSVSKIHRTKIGRLKNCEEMSLIQITLSFLGDLGGTNMVELYVFQLRST